MWLPLVTSSECYETNHVSTARNVKELEKRRVKTPRDQRKIPIFLRSDSI